MLSNFESWLTSQGLSEGLAQALEFSAALAALLLLALLTGWAALRFLAPLFERTAQRSSSKWDDTLVERLFFKRSAYLLPSLAVYLACDLIYPPASPSGTLFKRAALILFVIISVRVLDAFLSALHDIYRLHGADRAKPIRGYIQAVTILVYIMAGIFIVAIATGQSPWGILTVLGGLTAVLLLVFKDTLLGFVASIQLSTNDMVQVGDWIEMPKYGADGEVIDISINTIKVRNWDKTIATIPTYALVSDSFKNWRGMAESGGRRIKRALLLDMNSIRFCSEEMLRRFAHIELLTPYLTSKGTEIAAYNAEHHPDPSSRLNGRQQTNIGILRAYIIAYLKHHPQIRQDMTFLVRQLEPTPQGLPMEIYVFSRQQAWADYEAVQADIFDHILAAVPEFGLRIFQFPAGHDLKGVLHP
ncbi:mechanosensitive ion channel family protein [Thiovibrio frasassiensis]|jgi:miniconductance mechanosensitive channel|uniref:Mechanosensing system component YbdG n=1 Tax=Thiovibrio frasassiensis TaxID=2984131 RepID=A0A9X4MEG3_9BACT|nr:mechanosensitive ion channel domain-containing protein [Thiovibrio frasassiensis]MDG4475122.1 mechanosensitive ion channel family protein [Thiovibrio frasassiensis]